MTDDRQAWVRERLITLRRSIARASADPEEARREVDKAIRKAAAQEPAEAADEVEQILLRARRLLREVAEELRRDVHFLLLAIIVTWRTRFRTERVRPHAALLGNSAGVLTVESAGAIVVAVAMVGALAGGPSGGSVNGGAHGAVDAVPRAVTVLSDFSAHETERPAADPLTRAPLAASASSGSILGDSPAGADAGARVGGEDPERIEIGERISVEVGDDEYTVRDGTITWIPCDDFLPRRALCDAYHAASTLDPRKPAD